MSSKKSQDKAKAKVIEDKTFGLKNKNRSTKVQAFVHSVTQSVKQGNPQQRQAQAENEQKRKEKEAKKAFQEEMEKLFKAVDAPKKVAGTDGEEDLGCDPDEYLFRPEDFEAVQEDDSRLEEKLEAEREALKGRTDLTPVTEETFQAWKAQKRKEAAEKEAARLKKSKETGVLRGWDLWQHDQALFVDDEDADEFYEREEIEEEFDLEDDGATAKHADPTAM